MFMLPVIGVVSLERARETEGEKKRSLVRRSEEKEGKRERERKRERRKEKKEEDPSLDSYFHSSTRLCK